MRGSEEDNKLCSLPEHIGLRNSLRTGLVSSMASGSVISSVSHIFDNASTQAVRDEDDWKLITSRRSVILSLYKNVTQG
jgi:hypothetical protein